MTTRSRNAYLALAAVLFTAGAFIVLAVAFGSPGRAAAMILAGAAGATLADSVQSRLARRRARLGPDDLVVFVVPLDASERPLDDPQLITMRRRRRRGGWHSLGSLEFPVAAGTEVHQIGIQQPTYVPGRHDWLVSPTDVR